MEQSNSPDVMQPIEVDTTERIKQPTDYYSVEQLGMAMKVVRGFALQAQYPNNLEIVLHNIERRCAELDLLAYVRFQEVVSEQKGITKALWRGQPVKRLVKVQRVTTTATKVVLTTELIQELDNI